VGKHQYSGGAEAQWRSERRAPAQREKFLIEQSRKFLFWELCFPKTRRTANRCHCLAARRRSSGHCTKALYRGGVQSCADGDSRRSLRAARKSCATWRLPAFFCVFCRRLGSRDLL